jgi:hypothetical protein
MVQDKGVFTMRPLIGAAIWWREHGQSYSQTVSITPELYEQVKQKLAAGETVTISEAGGTNEYAKPDTKIYAIIEEGS